MPVPEVEWFKDGISIQNNPDYHTSFYKGICQLRIEETFTEDSAKFTCKAINAAGKAETHATLSVKGKNYFNFLTIQVLMNDIVCSQNLDPSLLLLCS